MVSRYVRGSKADYDGWASLGNKGWDFESLEPYFKKHQTLDPPQKEPNNKQFMPAGVKSKYHGTDGPIHTSFNDFYQPFEEE
jgi:choline dehydrogenase-like flavoprotein